ncbi:hypothetical protein ABTM96_20270, partial [Acinetobacter baumannii]
VYHGFILAKDGTLAVVDFPGGTGTSVQGVNSVGVAAGCYTDPGRAVHGYFRDANGVFTSFDVPGAANTCANAINDNGSIAGTY